MNKMILLSTHIISSILASGGAIASGGSGADASSMIFAHVVAGGGYSTVFTLTNTGASSATGTLALYDQAGKPFQVTMTAAGAHPQEPSIRSSATTDSSFPINLNSGATAVLKAERPGNDAISGWARLDTADGSASGVATFQFSAGTVLKTIAGVLAAPAVASAVVPIDNGDPDSRYAGFAIANPGDTDIHVSISMRAEDGSLVGAPINPAELNPLGSKMQVARFLTQYFPATPSIRGSITLSAQSGEQFATVALSLNQGLFTAIPVVPQTSGWRLVWHDEFEGADQSLPDTSKWGYDLGGSGWGNNELEWYTSRPENAHIEGGKLVITARRETIEYRDYTSARMLTKNKFVQKYGRVEARLQLPYGQGMWPAFWMLGNDIDTARWPACGEIDIMENIGKEPSTVHGTLHGPGYSGGNGIGASYPLPGPGRFADDFHIFAIEWEPTEIRWYVDDHLYKTVKSTDIPSGTRWVFDHPFFIILNVAVGGGWPGNPDSTTVFPQKMLVDYVRVYDHIQ